MGAGKMQAGLRASHPRPRVNCNPNSWKYAPFSIVGYWVMLSASLYKKLLDLRTSQKVLCCCNHDGGSQGMEWRGQRGRREVASEEGKRKRKRMKEQFFAPSCRLWAQPTDLPHTVTVSYPPHPQQQALLLPLLMLAAREPNRRQLYSKEPLRSTWH